jgi:hypothetical protein
MALDNNQPNPALLGWREWVSLPDLGIAAIKTKVDTGAKTSALHAFDIVPFEENGETWVRFGVHPLQDNDQSCVNCIAKVKAIRPVTDSGGRTEKRFVIETSLFIDNLRYPIEVSLTDRVKMRFRMLLGRSALKGRFWVDSQQSFLLGGNKKLPAKPV